MSEQEKSFTVTGREPGYAHIRYFGTYEGPVTVEDVRARFYHSYFGGRDARIDPASKTFSVITYTD